MWDSFDFATVSFTVTDVAKEFGVENSEVTWVSLLLPDETHFH
jgi:SHS family lactate transporter-like MFS transporter